MNIQHKILVVHNQEDSLIGATIRLLQSQNPNTEELIGRSEEEVVSKIKTLKPSAEEIAQSQKNNIQISYPIVFFFVRDYIDKDINNFFSTYKTFISDHDFTIKYSESEDYNVRFCVVISQDFERSSVKDIKLNFHDSLSKFKKDNDESLSALGLALRNTYFVLIDRYNEKGLRFDDTKALFQQLGKTLNLLYNRQESSGYLPINNSRFIPGEIGTYNSLGLASIGFQEQNVRKGIKTARKSAFLSEVVSDSKLTEDVRLEISNISNVFIKTHIQPTSENIRINSFDSSFDSFTAHHIDDFKKEQTRLIENLNNNDFSNQSLLIQNKIDRECERYSLKLETAQENSIRYSSEITKMFKEELGSYVNNLMTKYQANNSIEAGLIGLINLVEKPVQHLVIEKGVDTYETVKEIKEKIEQENNQIEPANVDERGDERNEIIEKLNRINQKISKQIEDINNYNLSRRIKLNSLWNLVGLVLAFLIIRKIPTFSVLDFDIITLSDKVKFSLWPLLITILIFAFKSIKHYRQFQNLKRKLVPIGNDRISVVREYIGTYHNHFEAIKNKLVLEHSGMILNRFLGTIDKEKHQLNSFKQSLKNLKKKFDLNSNDFLLEEDVFNKSIIDKDNILDFCKNHPLEFFDQNNVHQYYSEYKKGKPMFEPFLPKLKRTRLDVIPDEIIAANKEDGIPLSAKEYCELQINNTLFLATDTETNQILYSDVKQGKLGDCYFLAALASIAHKEEDYIDNMVHQNGENYTIRFYDDDLISYDVDVDKKFWVDKETSYPIYADFGSSTEDLKETWTMYIEKAWAKINNMDYTNIVGSIRGSRKIDFSLALTGKRAIKEHLSVNIIERETTDRLIEHLKKKPIVLYSLNSPVNESEDNLVTNHAYALLKIDNKICEIYNPHGSVIHIPLEKLRYNFDTILYFDFEIETDKHLLGLYSDFIVKSGSNSLLMDMDNLIESDLITSFDNKSFEQLLPSFNYELSEEKAENFAEFLISASTPNVYLPNLPSSMPSCQIIGRNEFINEEIKKKLKDKGFKDDDYISIDQNLKKIGLLQIRNNIKIENTGNP